MNDKHILWWGRFDPEYSRNRIVRQALRELGWTIQDFHPHLSLLGDLEARWRIQHRHALVWVPCFRQRDVAAASRWARRQRVPLLFDPLISAFDKQIFERNKLAPDSARAQRLLHWERELFGRADILLADTQLHADFYHDTLRVDAARIHVVPVGAEENLFQPNSGNRPDKPCIEALFYGSFIPLQGPEVIVEAARLTQGENIRWHLLGQGPLRANCEKLAAGLDNIVFEEWLPYAELPARIHQADILLGVFGATPKAGRVIPNKVFQALACGKPVVTQRSLAYPIELQQAQSGIGWVGAAQPTELADIVRHLAGDALLRSQAGEQACQTYQAYFSAQQIRTAVAACLNGITRNVTAPH